MRAERAGIGNLACLVVALKMGPRKRVTQFLMNSPVDISGPRTDVNP